MKSQKFVKVTVVSTDGDDTNLGEKLLPVDKICEISPTGCGCEDGKGQTLVKVETDSYGSTCYNVLESMAYFLIATNTGCTPCDDIVDPDGCP